MFCANRFYYDTNYTRLRPNLHTMISRSACIQGVLKVTVTGTWLVWLYKNHIFFHANGCMLTKLSLSVTFPSLCPFRFLPLPNPQMAVSSLCEFHNSSQFTYRVVKQFVNSLSNCWLYSRPAVSHFVSTCAHFVKHHYGLHSPSRLSIR